MRNLSQSIFAVGGATAVLRAATAVFAGGGILCAGIFGAGHAWGCSGAGAASSADRWAKSQNSGYPDFGGTDCTNFVSQALHSGGFSYVGGSSESSLYQWWIRRNSWGTFDYATTWSVAPRLRQFLINDAPGGTPEGTAPGTSTTPYTPASVVTGDVLFYDWGSGEGISHASIQVGIGHDDTSGYVGNYVDMHSNDRLHAFWSLRPYNPQYKTTTVHFMHVWAGNS